MRGDWDIWRIALAGDSTAEPWLSTENREDQPTFSPDGRWVVYSSSDSGRREVYLRPYTGVAVRNQISTKGASVPRWPRSGGEIFSHHFRVDVSAGDEDVEEAAAVEVLESCSQ